MLGRVSRIRFNQSRLQTNRLISCSFINRSVNHTIKSRAIMSSSSNTNLVDPTEAHFKPPFNDLKEQDWPGLTSKMNPRPDHGETSYKGSGKLANQIALITGADSGIGRAVALAFAREGCDVAVAYYNEHEDAKEIQQDIQKEGRQCILLPGDLAKEEECKKMVDETVKKFGRIDLLVLNAAFQGKSVDSILELTRERVQNTFNVNIISMFSTVRYAVPHMKKGGAIITTGSVQAYSPSSPILDYASTKAAIVGFTKGLASELVPKGIRVNCVAPGPVITPLVAASFPTEKLKTFGEKYPIGRPAQPCEVAPAYVFLASQESRYVNSEILAVTGGQETA